VAERTVSVALQAKVTGFVAGMRTAKKAADDLGSGLLDATSRNKASLDDLANNAGILGAALTGIGALAVKKFMDFDKAMSSVKATGDDARGSIDKLRDAAIQAGADTAFSATEAANGIENLAKAGVSANDILGGGLKGALDLAAAGQINVADAAETAASAMTQFNLTGADVPHIADLLAAGAGKAQGEVGDMAQALAQSGLVAAQFGLSIEDTTGTLAAFASAGLLGSDAGTSFKTMLLALANPAEATKETMQNLGVAAYDAQGNFVGVANLAQQLKDKLGPLSQAQRDAALAQIFGSDAIRAANVLYQQGGQGITDWIGKVDDSGFAAETAATKMDNLAGDIETFTGSLETALIGVGEGADGPLRGLVQGATDAVNAFSDLPGPVQSATLAIVGGGGLALLATAGMIKVVTAISDTKDALSNLGITAGRAGTLLRFAAVPAALAVATTAVDTLADHLSGLDADSSKLSNNLDDWATKGKLTGDAARLMGDNFNWLDDALSKVADSNAFESFTGGVEKYLVPWTGAVEDAQNRIGQLDEALAHLATSGSGDEAAEVFKRITDRAKEQGISVAQVKEVFPQYADALRSSKKATDEAEKSTRTYTGTTEKAKPKILEAAGALDQMEERASGLNDTLGVLNSTLENLDAESAYEQSIDDLQTRFKEYREEVKKGDEATKGMKGAFDLTTQAGRDNAGALRDLWQRSSEYAVQTLETTGNQRAANGVLAAGRQQLVNMATQFLGSKSAAEKYVTEVLGIPKDVKSQWQTPGLSPALANARNLNAQADRADGRRVNQYWTTQFTEIHRRVTRNEVFGQGPGFASGGLVRGPGSPTSDSIAARLSDGEFVVNARAAARNMALLERINSGFAPTGDRLDLGAYKRGGRPVMTSLAGTSASSGAAGTTVTNNFYPRSVDINEANLASFTHAARVRERVGRPR
jgi:TP901 family phage tail tape measure protein